jgi:succinate dehydrogenase/fumarate reductase flavoprotein subunit
MMSALEPVKDLQSCAGRIVLQNHGSYFNSDLSQAFELDPLLDAAETRNALWWER